MIISTFFLELDAYVDNYLRCEPFYAASVWKWQIMRVVMCSLEPLSEFLAAPESNMGGLVSLGGA